MTSFLRHSTAIGFIISASFLSSCNVQSDGENPPAREDEQKVMFELKNGLSTLKELQSENAALNKKLSDTTLKVQKLEESIVYMEETQRKLNQKTNELELKIDQYQSVNLDESDKGYQRLETESGFFLVKIRGNQPYLDGYKLYLEILNPNAVSYTGARVSVKWGRTYDATRQRYSAWVASVREKTTQLPTALTPGAKMPVEVMLPRTTQEELGFMSVSMQVEGVTSPPRALNSNINPVKVPQPSVPAPVR